MIGLWCWVTGLMKPPRDPLEKSPGLLSFFKAAGISPEQSKALFRGERSAPTKDGK